MATATMKVRSEISACRGFGGLALALLATHAPSLAVADDPPQPNGRDAILAVGNEPLNDNAKPRTSTTLGCPAARTRRSTFGTVVERFEQPTHGRF